MKKILVVDDDPAISEALQLALETAGYQVKVENDGAKTYEKAKNFLPDLILLDFLLPGRNGGEITRQLKSREKTKDIPVVIISAHLSSEKEIKNYGANSFIAKPFNIEDLLNKIKAYA